MDPLRPGQHDTTNTVAASQRSDRRWRVASRLWGSWIMLALLLFIAAQATVLAIVLQGKWFILLGPAIVCAIKAWETWSRLHDQMQTRRSNPTHQLF